MNRIMYLLISGLFAFQCMLNWIYQYFEIALPFSNYFSIKLYLGIYTPCDTLKIGIKISMMKS